MIVNKVHYESGDRGARRRTSPPSSTAELGDEDLARASPRTSPTTGRSRPATARNIERLDGGDAAREPVIQVPYLDEDVHDLAGLMEINRYLFAAGAEERAEIAASV